MSLSRNLFSLLHIVEKKNKYLYCFLFKKYNCHGRHWVILKKASEEEKLYFYIANLKTKDNIEF